MLKKIKQYFIKVKQSKTQKVELKKMQKYYDYLRAGATFIQFIRQDLVKGQSQMNRHQRRKMQKTLVKGELTDELIQHYSKEVDRILQEINTRLNSSKSIDGAKMYNQLKKKEK